MIRTYPLATQHFKRSHFSTYLLVAASRHRLLVDLDQPAALPQPRLPRVAEVLHLRDQPVVLKSLLSCINLYMVADLELYCFLKYETFWFAGGISNEIRLKQWISKTGSLNVKV